MSTAFMSMAPQAQGEFAEGQPRGCVVSEMRCSNPLLRGTTRPLLLLTEIDLFCFARGS